MSVDVPVLRHAGVYPDSQYTIFGGSQIITTGRFVVRGVHGVGTVNGTDFITKADDLAKALSGYEEEPEVLGGSIRGALTIYVEDRRTEALYILTDPLGSSIVYSYADSGRTYSSSSLRNLLGILKSDGIEPEKSLAYAAVLALTSFGGLVDSPYVDVTALAPFHFLEVSRSGIDSRTYPLRDEIFGKLHAYGGNIEGLRKQVISDILANLKAASRYQASSYICNISGELNERTVLAGLDRSGYREKYSLHTGGALTTEDTLNSRRVAGSMKMRVSRNPGYEIAIKPGSSAEDVRWRFHETSGVLYGPATAGLRRADSVVLAGGFGNLLRDPFPATRHIEENMEFDESSLLGLCLGEYEGIPGSPRKLLGEDLLEICHQKLRDIIKEAKRLNIPNDSFPEYLWLSTKSRYIDGESSRSLSEYSHRFDPLYSPWVIPAAWSYSRGDRRNNFLQLDIMCELNQELVTLPFNKNIRVAEFFAEHPQIKQRSFQRPQSNLDAHHFSLSTLQVHPDQVIIGDEHKSESARLGLPARKIAMSEDMRRRSLEMIVEIGSDTVSEYFEYDELVKNFKSKPRWVPEFRLVEKLHDGLAWFLE